MALGPIAASTASSGWKREDRDAAAPEATAPRRRAARPTTPRIGLVGGEPGAPALPRHRRAHDHEVERSGVEEHVGVGRRVHAAVDVRLAVDHRPGWKKPGMAHDAATASRHRRARARRDRTRRAARRPGAPRRSTAAPSARRRARARRCRRRSSSVLTDPSGSSAASSDHGPGRERSAGRPGQRGRQLGRRAAVPRLALQRRRPAAPDRPAAARAGPRPTAAGPRRGRAGRPPSSPARSDGAGDRAGRGADDRRRAVRGSHPVASSRAASTPAWNAPPATPPAPSTSPIAWCWRRHAMAADGSPAWRQASWRTVRPSTASMYSSTRRWMTGAVFSTELSWPTTWPTGLNCTAWALSA